MFFLAFHGFVMLVTFGMKKDAAGIVTCAAKGRFYQCKGNGMVRDVFNEQQLSNLVGSLGVGHGKFKILQTF